MSITVVICSHNPKTEILTQVLSALKKQTLAPNYWELILIDNSSTIPLAKSYDISWHPNAHIIIEDKLAMEGAVLSEFRMESV